MGARVASLLLGANPLRATQSSPIPRRRDAERERAAERPPQSSAPAIEQPALLTCQAPSPEQRTRARPRPPLPRLLIEGWERLPLPLLLNRVAPPRVSLIPAVCAADLDTGESRPIDTPHPLGSTAPRGRAGSRGLLPQPSRLSRVAIPCVGALPARSSGSGRRHPTRFAAHLDFLSLTSIPLHTSTIEGGQPKIIIFWDILHILDARGHNSTKATSTNQTWV